MPEPSKNVNLKKADLKIISDRRFARINVEEKKDPVLFQIKSLCSSEEGREKQNEIAKLCFGYLLNNKSMAYSKTQRDTYDAVLSTLSVVDARLATHVQDVVNRDPVMKSRIKRDNVKNLNLVELVKKNGTFVRDSSERTPITGRAKDDPRLANLYRFSKRFNSREVSPWYHKDRSDYKEMIKSIENALEYSKVADRGFGSKEILDGLLEDVKNKTLAYIERKSAEPGNDYGKARLNLAVATLLTLDRKKGMEVIDSIASKRLETATTIRKIGQFFGDEASNVKLSKSQFMSFDEILKDTGMRDFVSRDSLDLALKDKMDEMRNGLYDAEHGINEDKLAEYLVYDTMRESLKHMSEEEAKKFDISEAAIKKQCEILKATKEFTITQKKVTGGDPNKKVDPKDFSIEIKVVVADKASSSQALVKVGEENKVVEDRKFDVTSPAFKRTAEEYRKIKKALHLREDANSDQVRRAVHKQFMRFRQDVPDKLEGLHGNVRDEYRKTYDKIYGLNESYKNNRDVFEYIDNHPEVRNVEFKPEEVKPVETKPLMLREGEVLDLEPIV